MKSIKEIIEASIEPYEPQNTILKVLKEHEGKQLNKRLIAKLNEACGRTDISIYQIAGMTSIQWTVNHPERSTNQRLFVAYRVTNVTIDTAFISEHNTGLFDAAVKRNESRQKSLANETAITELEATIKALTKAAAKLKEFFKYDGIFYESSYSINKAYGIDEILK